MTRPAHKAVGRDWKQPKEVSSKDGLKAEVKAWAERIGVEPREIHIRSMRRKWASCSTAGRVSFNDDLLSESEEFRKKVIVHELLHIKVPNHGKLFKALLKAHLGIDDDFSTVRE